MNTRTETACAAPWCAGLLRAQVDAVESMLRILEAHARRLQKRLGPEGSPPDHHIIDWEHPNVFAFGGPRGAGKSTVLRALCEALRTPNSRLDVAVIEPIDCSAIPEETGPSVAVLAQIMRDERFWRRDGRDREMAECRKEFNATSSIAARSGEGYNALALELSTSLEEYPHYVFKGAKDRLALRSSLTETLDKALRYAKVPMLVVPLDDFDLTHGGELRAWRKALLDELRQDRLIFVTTADFDRLGHLSFEPDKGIDDHTGRALIEKMLPLNHRIWVREWSIEERWCYPRLDPASPPEDKAFGDHITAVFVEHQTLLAPVRQLLPRWPRGIQSLYRALSSGVPIPDTREHVSEPGGTFPISLAEARQEPLLARRLRDVPPGQWVAELQWPEATTLAVWRSAVTASLTDAPGVALRPLEALAPVSAQASMTRVIDPDQHEPNWVDPARHSHEWRDVLRDAETADRAWWAEFLVDRDLVCSNACKLLLLERWHALASSLRRTSFRLDADVDRAREFFSAWFPEPKALLPWVRWREIGSDDPPPREEREPSEGARISTLPPTDRIALEIGFSPLIEVIGDQRAWWPERLVRRLGLGPASVHGTQPTFRPSDDLGILPSHVRSMVLLFDSLDRCRWGLWSHHAWRWQLSSFARLAGALVRTAYLHALRRRLLGLRAPAESSVQSQFFKLLEGDQSLLDPREHETNKHIDALLREPVDELLEPARPEDPLWRAAHTFFSHSVYLALVRTVED